MIVAALANEKDAVDLIAPGIVAVDLIAPVIVAALEHGNDAVALIDAVREHAAREGGV